MGLNDEQIIIGSILTIIIICIGIYYVYTYDFKTTFPDPCTACGYDKETDRNPENEWEIECDNNIIIEYYTTEDVSYDKWGNIKVKREQHYNCKNGITINNHGIILQEWRKE